MNEYDSSRLELEPDQATLFSAWKDLAEALVLHGGAISQMRGEVPPYLGDPQPYVFSATLDERFVRDYLNDEDDSTITMARADYFAPHKSEWLDDDVQETVSVDWTEALPGEQVAINHSIVLTRVQDAAGEQYQGYVWHEYVRRHGTHRHINRSGRDHTDNTLIDELRDHSQDMFAITLDDIERVYAVAKQLRATGAVN